MRTWFLIFALGAAGCDATFFDLRPDAGRPSPDLAQPADLTIGDLAGADLAGLDLTPLGDTVIATGTFMPRVENGAGSCTLVQRADGVEELRFGSNFSADGTTSGSYVILTSRDTLKATPSSPAAADPQLGDLDLGVLRSHSGAQTYALPSSDGGRRYVFILCKPFSLEVSRAVLQ